MAEAGDRLRIKYGLEANPSAQQQKEWASLARGYLQAGRSSEAAGREAAVKVFVGVDRIVYASEGDTIEMLLRQIEDR